MPTTITNNPIQLQLNAADLRIAFVELRAVTSDPRWNSRIDDAAQQLTSARVSYFGSTVFVYSPRSQRTYAATATTCTCDAFARGNVPCWHRVVAKIVARVFARAQPSYRCSHCAGPMVCCTTPAGEACAECLVCKKTVMACCVADLAAWASPTRVINKLAAARHQILKKAA